jgi:hypothetical protein
MVYEYVPMSFSCIVRKIYVNVPLLGTTLVITCNALNLGIFNYFSIHTHLGQIELSEEAV